jgi:hypothetical protein
MIVTDFGKNAGFYPREHAARESTFCFLLFLVLVLWWMLYSIIANFVMVACRVVYCEFRHDMIKLISQHFRTWEKCCSKFKFGCLVVVKLINLNLNP